MSESAILKLSHNSRLHALYVYKRHSNAKYLIKMSELEEEVLLDLEFEVDEHSSTTSDSGTDSDDDDDGGVGEMEKREQFGEDGVDAGAGQVIAYQRELAELPAAAQLPRPRSTGDRSVMTGRDIFYFFGMCGAFWQISRIIKQR